MPEEERVEKFSGAELVRVIREALIFELVDPVGITSSTDEYNFADIAITRFCFLAEGGQEEIQGLLKTNSDLSWKSINAEVHRRSAILHNMKLEGAFKGMKAHQIEQILRDPDTYK